MNTIKFGRPTPALLSMNDRHHWRRKSQDVKAWRGATAAHGRALRSSPFPAAMVVVTLDVPDNRRRDPANFFPCVKAIVDGLVDAGWWPDDTPEWVTVVEPVLRVERRERIPAGFTHVPPLMVTVELLPR